MLVLARGERCAEIGFTRFLRNRSVTVDRLSEGASRHTAARAAGRDVLVLQDTSSIRLDAATVRRGDYGPVGKGGSTRGVMLHAALGVDANTGELIGLTSVDVWNRNKGRVSPHAQRAVEDKETHCWLRGLQDADRVLTEAANVTVVSDRESDFFVYFADRPEGAHVLVRAAHNRRLASGDKLFEHADDLKPAGHQDVTIPAAPGRPERRVRLALRYGEARLLRPKHGMPGAALQALPEEICVSLVDIREINPPDGVEPVHWRLLTSHKVTTVAMARKMLAFYRKRWIIEDFFRTLKSSGFDIEEADIADPHAMMNLVALAAIAAVTVTQMLRARDNPSDQPLLDAFDASDEPILEAICKSYEGPNPTARQTNPYPKGTLARATWVIARLGAWTGYYGKPGALVLSRGLKKYQLVKYGKQLDKKDV